MKESKRSTKQSTKRSSTGFDEVEIIEFLKDLFYDSAEQTNALKRLADAFTKILEQLKSCARTEEIKKVLEELKVSFKSRHAESFQSLLERLDGISKTIYEFDKLVKMVERYSIDSQAYKSNDERMLSELHELNDKLEGVNRIIGTVGDKSETYWNLIKEFVEMEKKKQDFDRKMEEKENAHKQEIQKLSTKNKWDLAIKTIGFIFGGSGLVVVLVKLLGGL